VRWRSSSSGAASAFDQTVVGAGERVDELVQLELGGLLEPVLSLLQHEDHHDRRRGGGDLEGVQSQPGWPAASQVTSQSVTVIAAAGTASSWPARSPIRWTTVLTGGFVGMLVSPGRSGLDHEASSLTDAKVRDRSELMTEVRARAALSMDERTRRASDRDIRSMGEGLVVVRTHPEKAAAGVATEVLDRVPGVRRVKVIDVSRPAAPHQPRPRR
jgi:hypothetical protein